MALYRKKTTGETLECSFAGASDQNPDRAVLEGMLACIREEYGDTYIDKRVYDLNWLMEETIAGRLLTAVAFTGSGEAAACICLRENPPFYGVGDLCMHVVRKAYRGYGIGTPLVAWIIGMPEAERFSAIGSRVGALVSRNKELMGEAVKICQGRLCIATLDQLGAAAMYNTLTPEYYADVCAEYHRRREAIVTALKKLPGVTFNDPEGAFYLMASLPVDDAEKLQYFLLEEFEDHGETVMFAPGEGFYATPGKGRNEIRIAYVTNPEDLTRAVELLGLGIEAYNARKEG